MSFRLKIILGMALIQGILLAILIGGLFSQLHAFGRQQEEQYARQTLAAVSAMVREHVIRRETDRLAPLLNSFARNPDVAYLRILGEDGRELAASTRSKTPGAGSDNPVIRVSTDLIHGGHHQGRVELGVGTGRLKDSFQGIQQRAWLLAGLGMSLGALFSVILGSYLARYLGELRDGARRLQAGELGLQVPVRGRDELAQVVKAFNALSSGLLQRQRQEQDYKALLQSQETSERQRLEDLVKERTQALDQTARELRSLVDNMPVNVVRYDRYGQIAFVTPGFERGIGMPARRLIGRGPVDLTASLGAEALRVNQVIEIVLATGRPMETDIRIATPQGPRIHQMRMVAERDEQGRVSGVLAVDMDITERRESEARLALMSFAMNRVSEAALLIDEQANIIYANKGAGDTLGFSPEELIGKNMAELRMDFDPDDWANQWREIKAQGSLVYEVTNQHRDGREVRMEVNATFFEVDGKGYDLALGRDISARRLLDQAREAALTEAERLARVKSEFLANMSHEIRTPLNAILGMAQLGQRVSRGRRVQGQFGAILDAGQLLQSLVDDILDFSKIEAGRLSLEQDDVDTGQLIDRVVELTAPRAYAKGLEYTVREAADLPVLFLGDSLRLTQVLVNLLANAIKFTEAGSVSLTVARESQSLLFTVTDTGIGMNEEQISRLFVPFEQADGSTTRRFGGTGLGLAISKRLVDLMGGDITASGRTGQGMTFRIRLPVPDLPPPRALPPVGHLWLTGPGCALDLAMELHEWGVEVLIGAVADALAGEPGPLVVSYASLTQPDGQDRINQALSAGRRVGVILPPGGSHAIPVDLLDKLDTLAWPARSRHLLRLFTTPLAPARAPETAPTRQLAGLSLLIAEDNDLNRMILEELLSHEGARVESVSNGRTLVDRVIQSPGDFDMVITDVQMPEMDGFEAARQIVELAPGLPVIGLTAHVLGEQRRQCLDSGMVAHVGKPTKLDVLVKTILEHLRPAEPVLGAPAVAAAAVGTVEETEMPGNGEEEPDARDGEVDWVALAADFMNREDLIRRACSLLVDDHAGTPARLRDLAQAGQRDELARLTHNLKGMAGNLRAHGVQEHAIQVELALRESDSIDRAGVENLAAGLERLLAEAAHHLGQASTLPG